MTPMLREKLSRLPDDPGVYLMKDAAGRVIYVGKAVNLKNRVRQYFHSTGHTPKVQAMADQVADLDTVLTSTEMEALMLECNLIKHHRPRYNILLMDDKQYPYVRVDLKEDYPAVTIVRRMQADGARYFGPYIGAHALREVMDSVRTLFPLRTCKGVLIPGKRKRPCLNAAIGQCLAPCTGNVPKEEYRQLVTAVCDFLQGKDEAVLPVLQKRMAQAAQRMEYEKAALYRDRIRALERVLEKQRVSATDNSQRDIWGIAREGERALVLVLRVRAGKMLDPRSYTVEHAEQETEADILAAVLQQHYDGQTDIPKEVLTPPLPEGEALMADWLARKRGSKVLLLHPQRGEKVRLMEMAAKNAADDLRNAIAKEKRAYERTMGAVYGLQQLLGLEVPPRRIECYDNSNFQGTDAVSSMVVFHDGAPAKNAYRRFKVKTVVGADDFATMRELIGRRMAHGLEEKAALEAEGKDPKEGKFSHMPDLIVIDGGQGQLAYALEAMRETGVDIPMIGLAEEWEEIWQEGAAQPIRLPKHSEVLQLLQRIRDEAHRFAITYHRTLRGKRGVSSRLESIPGVGPARRRALLKAYPTLTALAGAEVEELRALPGMDSRSAQAVYDYFHSEQEA